MSLHADEEQELQIFCRQYLQLVDADSLAWPASQVLKKAHVQQWLFQHMFDQDWTQYLPPERYQARVLKKLMTRIEEAIEDPEEDEISDNLMSALSLLLSSNLPSESASAQAKSYVSYDFGHERTVTLLESRSIISSSGTTGLRTWEAALHLGAFLTTEAGSQWIRGKRILELGAGTGLVSILCAKHVDASRATITDGDEGVVDSIKTNVFLNGLDTAADTESIVLRWGRSCALRDSLYYEDEGQQNQYDVVLGADVTYDKTVIPALVATLADMLQRQPSLNILIAATIRNEETFEAFSVVCRRNGLDHQEVQFAPPLAERQTGPFYATSTPIRIVKVSKVGEHDAFSLS
ncbi:putative methyltransferase-domain-containing protein [Phyllosticta citribraziliensis]|uniref:Methyltransferase-domain-containing protein n=1 Tax=Phyllosticta citribraziliensis TaxID=989973 RepID=A0ABR1LTT6_9PEZI